MKKNFSLIFCCFIAVLSMYIFSGCAQPNETSLTNIEIKQNIKTNYFTSDTSFDVTGGKITCSYNDDSSEEINITSIMLSSFNNTVGTHTCTITYNGKTTTFNYIVVEVCVLEITIIKQPQLLYYSCDSCFDVGDGKIGYRNNDGTTGFVLIALNMLSEFDNSIGVHLCDVEYKNNVTHFQYTVTEEPENARFNLLDELQLKIENQESYGLCYAYAATTMAESYFQKHYGVNWQFDVSDMALVSNDNCPRPGVETNPLMTGGSDIYIIEYLKNIGLKIEDNITDATTYNTSDPVAYIANYKNFTSNREIKEYIKENGCISAKVYIDNNYSINNSYIYNVIGIENHEICIIGWDDSRNAWLCLNSWGEDWKGNGCFYLSYNYKLKGTDISGQTIYINLFEKSFGIEYGYFASKIQDDFSNETNDIKQTNKLVMNIKTYYAVSRENNFGTLKINYVDIVGFVEADTTLWIFESDTDVFNGFDVTQTSLCISDYCHNNYVCPIGVVNGRMRALFENVDRLYFEETVTITSKYYFIVIGINPENIYDTLLYDYSVTDSSYSYINQDMLSWTTYSNRDLMINIGYSYSNEIIQIIEQSNNKFIIDFECDLLDEINVLSSILVDFGYENGDLYVIISATGFIKINYNDEYNICIYFEYTT